jgi:outer membrane protein OmpA-like peptidoglycan-associated protein
MNKLLTCLLLSFALFFVARDLPAQSGDAEGCKDSPLITRFPGSTISSCDNKEYEQAEVSLKDKDGSPIPKTVEGEYHTWDYVTREGVSEIQIFRNFETALKNAGFALDYELSPAEITAHKGNTWFQLSNRGTYYDQTIVIAKDLQQEVTASSLAGEINTSGHVAVYGIHFDTGKATIQPDSDQTLTQIVQLLMDNPDLKLRVEGYTDNVGQAAANQALSERRAQAVVAWLTARGVPATRLAAKGLGAANPVADNSTDEGRAKNRRVELVKM